MRWRLVAAGVAIVLAGLAAAAFATRDRGGSADGQTSRPGMPAATPSTAATTTATADTTTATEALDPVPASVTIDLPARATGRRVPAGFLGLSFEFQAVRTYTGSDPAAINPVLIQLIRNLTPGQRPVVRIGGDSTDQSYVPAPGVTAPPYASYELTPSWLATTAALAQALGARMIMGLNLAANDPRLAGAEARAFLGALGGHNLDALEIGNEPNVYSKLTVLRTLLGIPLRARARDFGYPAYRRQFEAIVRASPRHAVAGPALAIGPTPSHGSWIHTIADFLRRNPRVQVMTVHRYPLRNCYVPPASPQYPTIAHLLAPYATAGLAKSLSPWLHAAHAQHRQLRVDELNSVACRGMPGVSDTFASSLWSVDALFSLVDAGVSGVNVHTLPEAAYQLFTFARTGGQWQAAVRPVYYGLQLFAQAAPAGSRLLTLPGAEHSSVLSAWATLAPDHRVRVVLIDKDRSRGETVTLHPPRGTPAGATVERMRAPGVAATSGVTLGGSSYGPETTTGTLPPMQTETAAPGRHDSYTIKVPPDSAALVTFGASR